MTVDPEMTVREWKDPDHRGEDHRGHPAGVIALDAWGGSTLDIVTTTCTLTPMTMITCTMLECCAATVLPQTCDFTAE